MKAIVVGATGYIGAILFQQAKKILPTIGTSSSSIHGLEKLQLECPSLYDYKKIEPGDVVFITAAISAPDICANEHDYAWNVNVIGTSEFITKVIARGGRVVFFSSDTVYGECSDTFDESAESNPSGEYAEMKNEVENRFFNNPLFKSIRLSYVFSREDKFTKYLLGCVDRGDDAELFHPFYRAVVHRDDVVEGVLALANRWDEFPQNTINFGGPEVLSRINFAEYLKKFALPKLGFKVTEPADAFFKNRPRIIAMSSQVLPILLKRPCLNMIEASRIEFL